MSRILETCSVFWQELSPIWRESALLHVLVAYSQSARLADGRSENHGESNGCDGTEEGGADDNDGNTRRVVIKSGDVAKTDAAQTNGNVHGNQSNDSVVRRADGGELYGLNGKHSSTNGDVKKSSIIKILEGSNTRVLTSQEGKSLLSLGKTTSAKVPFAPKIQLLIVQALQSKSSPDLQVARSCL